MNLLRRAQDGFQAGREAAVAALRRAEVVASDETSVRIEGSNAYHWVFRSPEAVVHHAAPTRAASVVRDMMDGHRPALWLSDRYPPSRVTGWPIRPVWRIWPAMSLMASKPAMTPCRGASRSG
jgi:transposase